MALFLNKFCNGQEQGSTDIDATYNWWGTVNNSEIQQNIYDWFKNGSLGIVNYVPYLPEPASETVNQVSTVTSVASSHNPSVFGQLVTFNTTVSVVLTDSGIPTGSVTFKDGTIVLGLRILNSSGQAIFSTDNLSVGSHTITAVYTGDDNFSSSTSQPLTQKVNPTANVNVSVMCQGSSRPESGWVVPLTVKFFTSGNITLVDVLKSTPDFTFNPTATKSGNFTTAEVSDVVPGNYDISVTSPHCLINVKRNVSISGNNTTIDMGTLLEGNANDDNKINIQDFGLLAKTYGKQKGQEGFDENADFDRNDKINITDFGLLAANYGKHSPIEVP
jgi:hypothetical protein